MGTIKKSIDADLDAAIFTMEGEVGGAEILNAIDSYYKGTLTKYTLWDYTKVNKNKHLTNADIVKIGKEIDAEGKARDGSFDLIVVPDLQEYGLSRIYASYGEVGKKYPNALKTIVVRSREEALKWIKANER